MKGAAVVGITILVVLIFLYEWPKMKRNQKKEKAAFVALTAMGWVLAVLLVFFPDMPGPTQVISKLFKPLGQMLEKSRSVE
jgi:multisubunit Na+/H+ antiporter MnhB subunit